MPIRPEIALAFQQPQIESPLNAYAKFSAIQNAQNQNALAQYQLSSAQRQDAQQNALNDAYRGAIGPDGQIDYRALTARLAGAGAGAAIPGVEHARLQNMTAQATLDKTQAETRAKQMTEFAHGMMAVYDDPSDDNVISASQRMIAAGANPKFVNAQAQQFLSIADPAQRKEAVFKIAMSSPEARAAIEAVQPKWTERGDGASKWLEDTNPMSRTVGQRRSVAQEQVTPSAQLSATVAREGHQVTREGHQVTREGHTIQREGSLLVHETPDGVVTINNKTGKTAPVTVGGQPVQGKGANLTESQGKAVGYGIQMAEANKIINKLEDDGVTHPGRIKGTLQGVASVAPFVGDKLAQGVGSAMNVVSPYLGGPNDDQIKLDAAQTAFLSAIVRQESGASFTQMEWDTAKAKYFPKPGDPPEAIAQKRAAREAAIRGVTVQAGPGAKQIGAKATAPTAASSGVTVSGW